MPEVPELNVMCSTVKKLYGGKKVKSIEILWAKRVKASQQEFDDAFAGAVLECVKREGKEMHLQFGNGNILGIHLMLTGNITTIPSDKNVKYPIFEMIFEDGGGFIVSDGMGQAKPILNPEVTNVPDIEGENFTHDYFSSVVKKSRKMIKDLIQEQKLIKGIGNAYADEILWAAKISPWSMSKAIPEDKIKDLYEAIISVTKAASKGLESVKVSEFDFSLENKDHRFVHNPKRKNSPEGEEILKGKVGNSKTFYTESQVLYK
jgi:formamidopyrimidine-DNA glycosylase